MDFPFLIFRLWVSLAHLAFPVRHAPGHVLVVLVGVEGAVEGRDVQVALLGRDLPPLVRPPLPIRLRYPGDNPGHRDKLYHFVLPT